MRFLTESLDKNVKPLVASLGKFSLRNLLVDWNRRNKEILNSVHTKGEAIISGVHQKGSEIFKGAHNTKEEIISTVHEKGEELLTKKKQIISSVQGKGEELLAKKKQIISNVHEKGEELLAKKKQALNEVHHQGEHLIEEVLDGAKKTIAKLTPDLEELKKPLYDETLRRKRETENLEADLLENEAVMQELNEVDTKMFHDVEPSANDVPYKKPAIVQKKPVIKPELEYYTLPEIAGQFLQWAG